MFKRKFRSLFFLFWKLINFSCNFWRDSFESLCGPKQLTEFYVMDVELVQDFQRNVRIFHLRKN